MNYIVDASVALCWVIRRPLTLDERLPNCLGRQFPFVIPLSTL